MENSILFSVKKALGIDQQYTDFDFDIIMSINSAIHTLYQVGYDAAKNFIVEGSEQTWTELSPKGGGLMSLIKTYIYAKVRMLFDPPTSSFVLTSLENQTKELEWRIYAEMEGGFDEDESDDEHHRPHRPNRPSKPDCPDDSECPEDPWEGVPGNGERPERPPHHGHKPKPEPDDGDESEPDDGLRDYLPDALRGLRDALGYPERSS